MTYNTRLGICIPTYKRPEQLRLCVNSIIASAAPFDVPIFIADDSTDDTNTEVIADLRRRYPYLVYKKNIKNLGIDRNILHSVDMCPCDYAWLMGEDDRIKPEAVTTVLAKLENLEAPPAFVAVNYSSVDEKISIIIKERLMAISEDKNCSADEFFRRESAAIGFIGSCVVNKALWDCIDPEPYIDTYFAHVGCILAAISGRQVALIAKPLVLNRAGRAAVFTWSANSTSVYAGWNRLVWSMEPLYGAESCRACIESFNQMHGINTLRFLCSKRADNIYNQQTFVAEIRPGPRSLGYKLAAALIARMDPRIFQAMHHILARVRTKTKIKVGDLS